MTLLFVDCETTGIDRKNDSIIQISGTIMNEEREKSFDLKMRPYKPNKMDPDAAMKTGYTDEVISEWQDQKEAFQNFINLLNEFIDILDWNSRAFVVGWNVGFDTDFIREWMSFNDKSVFGKYFYSPNLDLMSFVGFHLAHDRKSLRNFKLETIYQYIFGEEMENTHNAMSDIIATRRIFNKVCSYMHGFKNLIREPVIKRRVVKNQDE